jgi:hypothetical protein
MNPNYPTTNNSALTTLITQTNLGSLAGRPGSASASDQGNWLQALANAWGSALDSQAANLTDLSSQLNNGSAQPSTLAQLTAASLTFQFESTGASASINASGDGLNTLARKE